MQTINRLFRHLFSTARSGRRTFPESVLQEIQDTIAKGEKLHRAEVRIIIEASLDIGEVLRKVSSRERACELFSDYRIWDTEENCGVLVYVNLADHQVEIITDRTVNRLVGCQEWQAVCRTMTNGFAKGQFRESTIAALEQLNHILHTVFPAIDGPGDNQLSNQPLILD